MSDKIVQLNEEVIKTNQGISARSVEETLNGLLEAEAEKVTQVLDRFARITAQQGVWLAMGISGLYSDQTKSVSSNRALPMSDATEGFSMVGPLSVRVVPRRYCVPATQVVLMKLVLACLRAD